MEKVKRTDEREAMVEGLFTAIKEGGKEEPSRRKKLKIIRALRE